MAVLVFILKLLQLDQHARWSTEQSDYLYELLFRSTAHANLKYLASTSIKELNKRQILIFEFTHSQFEATQDAKLVAHYDFRDIILLVEAAQQKIEGTVKHVQNLKLKGQVAMTLDKKWQHEMTSLIAMYARVA